MRICGIAFLLLAFFFQAKPFALEVHENARTVRVFAYVENGGSATMCKNRTEKECRMFVLSLFKPAGRRFWKEFGIVISVNAVKLNFFIDPKLKFSTNDTEDKKGIEVPHMYHRSLSAFADRLRKNQVDVDVVVGIAEGLPRGFSDLANAYYGTILMNARDPFFERNLIHEFGHMFCAKDNTKPNAMMNGRSTGMSDIFLEKDSKTILQNKNRIFFRRELRKYTDIYYSSCK